MRERDYQLRAIARIRDARRRGHRRIVVAAPTGSGKTVIACSLIRSALSKGSKVLFLAHRRLLVGQASRRLTEWGVPHGIIMAGEQPSWSMCQVASLQTLINREFPEADLIVPDECHGTVTPTYLEVFNHYDQATIVGLTATPVRADGRSLGQLYDTIVHVAKPSELMAQGHLVPVRVFAPSEPDLRKARMGDSDYDQGWLEGRLQEVTVVGDIISHWAQYGEDRPTVVWAPGVGYSRQIAEEFNSAGVAWAHIDGKTPTEEREAIFAGLESGRLRGVSSCGVLREGWDSPCVSCGILLQPTRSLGTYIQMAGRLMRPFKGKTDAILLDHSGAVWEHGFPDADIDWELADEELSIEAAIRKEKAEKPSQPLIECSKCGCLRQGGSFCVWCGHTGYEPAKRKVRTADGELVELDKLTRREKKLEKHPNQKAWDKVLGRMANMKRPANVKQAAALFAKETGLLVWEAEGIVNLPPQGMWGASVREVYPNYRRGK